MPSSSMHGQATPQTSLSLSSALPQGKAQAWHPTPLIHMVHPSSIHGMARHGTPPSINPFHIPIFIRYGLSFIASPHPPTDLTTLTEPR